MNFSKVYYISSAIYTNHPILSWIIFILLFLIISWALLRMPFFRISGLSPKYLLIFFLIKLFFAFSLQAVYTFYYKERKDADVYKYFDDAKVINSFKQQYPTAIYQIIIGQEAQLSPTLRQTILSGTLHFDKKDLSAFDASHRLLIRLHLFLLQFSMGNIATHILLFCFLSFLGQFLLLKTVNSYAPNHLLAAYLALLLFPSVSFWGAGLLKESLLFFALGISVFSLSIKHFTYKIICFAFGLFLLFLLKPLLLLIFAFVLLLYFIANTTNKKVVLTILFLLIFFLYQFGIIDYFLALLLLKRNQFTTLALAQHANSLLDSQFNYLSFADIVSLFLHNSLNAFFRPFIWEINSIFNLFFGLEGLILFVLLLFCFTRKSFYTFLQKYSLYSYSLLFGFIYLILISLSIPVLGAIVRYKVIALPFLLFPMVAFILEKNIFEKFLPKIKK